MTHYRKAAPAALALCLGWLAGVLLPWPPVAHAQDAKGIDAPRFQLEAYARGDARPPGAYVLDTETGVVFHVSGTSKPTRLGSVLSAR